MYGNMPKVFCIAYLCYFNGTGLICSECDNLYFAVI